MDIDVFTCAAGLSWEESVIKAERKENCLQIRKYSSDVKQKLIVVRDDIVGKYGVHCNTLKTPQDPVMSPLFSRKASWPPCKTCFNYKTTST